MSDRTKLKELLEEARANAEGAAAALQQFVQDHRIGEVLDTTRAATYCGLAVGTMYNLASRREGPYSHKHGRKTVYYPVDLDVYLYSRVRPAVAEAA